MTAQATKTIRDLAEVFNMSIESVTNCYENILMEEDKNGASEEEAAQYAIDHLPYALQNN